MKLKNSLNGRLLPKLKGNNHQPEETGKRTLRQRFFGAALVLLWILVYLFVCHVANAQTTSGLQVGDQVPDVTFGKIINNKNNLTKLSDLKGKLVILDFWGTYCGSCILAMHWMDSIQAKYAGKIQILEVTDESSKKVEAFFKLRTDAKGKHYGFNTVVEDKTLDKLFPHQGVPHIAWIGPDSKVIAISDLESVTEENINKVLYKEPANFGFKKEVDENKALFLIQDNPLDSNSYFSIFLKGHNPSLGSGARVREYKGEVYGRAFTNLYLIFIYKAIAYPLFAQIGDVFANNRVVLNVRDSSELIPKTRKNGFLEVANEYTYELSVPFREKASLNNRLITTLNQYSGFTCRIEKRKVQCLLLIRTDSLDRLKSKGGTPLNTLFNSNPRFINCPLGYLVNVLNDEKEVAFPVIDETGYTANVDLRLSRKTDIENLNAEFSNYGLKLVPAVRERNMLIITDKIK